MKAISCEVLTETNGKMKRVGDIKVHSIPRKGEYIWFSEERIGHSSWMVEDVCHWVGNGEYSTSSTGEQKTTIFAKPAIRSYSKA